MKRLTIYILIIISLLSCMLVACSGDGVEVNPPDEYYPPEEPIIPDIPAVPPKPPETPLPDKPAVKTEKYLKATTRGVNIRKGPGSAYAVIGSINTDDMVQYIAKSGNWYETVYKEQKAYISAKYTVIHTMAISDNYQIERIIEEGKKLLGYPYVWGAQRLHWGNGIMNANFRKGEFDCSSLTQYVYYKGADILLDVNTRTQVLQGKRVKDDISRGDLMFFTNDIRFNYTGTDRIGHVAIYLGDNYILHTADDYAVVEPISNKRWSYYILSNRFW